MEENVRINRNDRMAFKNNGKKCKNKMKRKKTVVHGVNIPELVILSTSPSHFYTATNTSNDHRTKQSHLTGRIFVFDFFFIVTMNAVASCVRSWFRESTENNSTNHAYRIEITSCTRAQNSSTKHKWWLTNDKVKEKKTKNNKTWKQIKK